MAVGWQTAGAELVRLLGDWADVVLVAEPYMAGHLPPDLRHKVAVVDVGPDTYHQPYHNDLVAKVRALLPAIPERQDD